MAIKTDSVRLTATDLFLVVKSGGGQEPSDLQLMRDTWRDLS